ncbi:MAG: hypothetical protein ACU84Q_05060 [Gammaproteobacteria bacterium]
MANVTETTTATTSADIDTATGTVIRTAMENRQIDTVARATSGIGIIMFTGAIDMTDDMTGSCN